jgi:hypothetical protein
MAIFLAAFIGIAASIFQFYNTDCGITTSLPYKADKIPGIPPFFLRHCPIRESGKAALDLVPGAG